MVSDMMMETTHYKLCLLVHKVFVGYAPDYIASLLTFLHGCRCVRRVTVTRSYQERVRRLVTGLSLLPHPCLESAADRLETLAFDCFIQEQTEEFSVSCCLHREHCVNSEMRHRSDCRGRTTSHCCYCYCYFIHLIQMHFMF